MKVYQFIRDNGGWDNWSMVEIEKFHCNDSNEAHTRERYWMETLNGTLNCNIPSRTKLEYFLAHKEQIMECRKIHRLAHKEQAAESEKIYRLAHKEQIAEYQKIHRLAHKEQIAEYRKSHYLANKEHQNERFDCPCGLSYSRNHKKRHSKTVKHLAYLENIESPSLAI